jgi:transposase-like protein
MRLPDRVTCPHCSSDSVIKDGKDDTDPQRQGYFCQGCLRRFDDLTGSILAGHHEPPQNWIICLYFIGLNLSSPQITAELDLDPDDVYAMVQGLHPSHGMPRPWRIRPERCRPLGSHHPGIRHEPGPIQ